MRFGGVWRLLQHVVPASAVRVPERAKSLVERASSTCLEATLLADGSHKSRAQTRTYECDSRAQADAAVAEMRSRCMAETEELLKQEEESIKAQLARYDARHCPAGGRGDSSVVSPCALVPPPWRAFAESASPYCACCPRVGYAAEAFHSKE